MTISERLAEYVLSITEESVPREVYDIAKTFFLDGISCMFLGTTGRSVELAVQYVKEYAGKGDCIFPSPEKLSLDAVHCAMLCAMSAHSNDYDDMSIAMSGHPGALLVPVVFSLGQKVHAKGKKILFAYIAGAEIDAIMGKAIRCLGCHKGWNPTNLIGIFGATAAAGYLLGLNQKQLANAFGAAVNEASGCKANFGFHAKDLAIGMTAMKAITAAECAKYGMDASPDAFENAFGFFESIFGGCDVEALLHIIDTHTSDFLDPGLVMKPYPSCRGNHSGIDCITKITKEQAFELDDVEQVICRTDQGAFDTDRYEHPQTPDEAKFSLAFCIAKVISCGNVCLNDFMGAEIQDQAALDFIKKVKIECRPEMFSESRFGTEVEVRLKDGTRFVEKEYFAKGDPKNPMTQEEAEHKLIECLTVAFGAEEAGCVAEKIRCFDEAEDIRQLLLELY